MWYRNLVWSHTTSKSISFYLKVLAQVFSSASRAVKQVLFTKQWKDHPYSKGPNRGMRKWSDINTMPVKCFAYHWLMNRDSSSLILPDSVSRLPSHLSEHLPLERFGSVLTWLESRHSTKSPFIDCLSVGWWLSKPIPATCKSCKVHLWKHTDTILVC